MEPVELLLHAASALERLGIPYFVTGSTASIVYGEPRLTNDIDIVAAVEPPFAGIAAARSAAHPTICWNVASSWRWFAFQ